MRNKVNRLFSVLLLCMLLFASCGSDAVFNQSVVLKDHTWKDTFHPVFKVNITDTIKTYDVVLTVRTTVDFPYSNLWMYWTIDGPMGKSKRFPLEVVTADPSGKWTGDKSGSLVSFSKLFMHVKFTKKGTYKLTFEQATTQQNVPEVVDLSLDVFEAKSEQ